MADRKKIKSAAAAEGPGGHRTFQEILVIILAVLAVTLPFVGKPLHMDGPYFLDFAAAKLEEPLRDSVPDYDFAGLHLDRFRDTHPPFTAGYLAVVMKLTGSASEMVLHLAFIPFSLLAAVAGYAVARRFVRDSLFAALLMVVAPGFVVLSSNLMSDVPLMAFWLAAVAAYIHGVDRADRRLLAAAALFVTLAFFCAYEALSLIPLLLAYSYLTKKFSLINALPLAGAAAVFFGYIFFEWLVVGELPRLRPQSSTSIMGPGISRFFPKASSVLFHLGGTIVFPFAILAVFWPRKGEYGDFLMLVLLFAAAPFVLRLIGLVPADQALQMAMLLPPAGLLLWGMLMRILNLEGGKGGNKPGQREWIFHALWLGGVLFYTMVILYHASVKYLLPAFLPVTLLIADQARRRFSSSRGLSVFHGAALITTAALALLVAAADYELAAAWRDFARSRPEVSEEGPARGWFTAEFGLRHYLEERGYRYLLLQDTRPQPGDIIIQPLLPGSLALEEGVAERSTLVEERLLEGKLPLRIINPPSGAGFYGHRWGTLPYSFSTRELDHIYIYKVN